MGRKSQLVTLLAVELQGNRQGTRDEVGHYSSTKKWPRALYWPDLAGRFSREIPGLCYKVRCSH